MNEATGEWRKLHSRELHNLYLSPNITRQFKSGRMRVVGHVARVEQESVQVFGGKAKGRRPLQSLRHKWEDGIKTNVREIGCESVEWIYLLSIQTSGRFLYTW
jgi:hypothetical protein